MDSRVQMHLESKENKVNENLFSLIFEFWRKLEKNIEHKKFEKIFT